MQALAESDVVLANNLPEDQRWPRFAPQVVSVTGVRSMLSLRLFLTRDPQGALNFYAAELQAFEAEVIPLAAIFASYTSVTLLNIVHQKEIFDLERAVQSNREIGVAIGSSHKPWTNTTGWRPVSFARWHCASSCSVIGLPSGGRSTLHRPWQFLLMSAGQATTHLSTGPTADCLHHIQHCSTSSVPPHPGEAQLMATTNLGIHMS
jgi:hypothetical protein